MDQVSLDFDQAKAKHLLFKSRLRSILYGIEVDEGPVVSHFECAVGKWIYDHALKDFGHIKEVSELEKVHAELHLTAKRLVELYRNGKIEESRLGLNEIENIAAKLVFLLDLIENKLKEENVSLEAYQNVDETLRELNELSKTNEQLEIAIKQQTSDLIQEKWLLQEAFLQIPAAISILRGPDFILQFANPKAFEILKDQSLIGKSIKETFPELGKQGYFELLTNVYNTGEPFVGKEMKATITLNGQEQSFYSDVSYSAIKGSNGNIEGILAFSYDVSDLVKARKASEAAAEKIRLLNEDLEIKVKYRNLELEQENEQLKSRLNNS
jgi:PAS domain-containing protein